MDDRTTDMMKSQTCKRCNRITIQEICRGISLSGSEYYAWWCHTCGWWAGSGDWIKKEFLTQQGIDLTIIRTAVKQTGERCARCHARGAEYHHWAPKKFFGSNEAENWPKDYLCVPCHLLWHKTINEKRLIADKR